jgi:hypothetical protein
MFGSVDHFGRHRDGGSGIVGRQPRGDGNRVLDVVTLSPHSAIPIESSAELAPDGNLDNIVRAPRRGAQSLLRKQRGTGKPCRVISQGERTVRVTSAAPAAVLSVRRAFFSHCAPSAAPPASN